MAGVLALASIADPRGPSLVLPSARRVLVCAPHPDDETIGCGGVVRRLVEAGSWVELLVLSDGDATIGAGAAASTVAAARRGEAGVAARRLGTRPPRSLGLPDGALGDHHDMLVPAIGRLVRRLQPELVLVPWALERHPDHRATTQAVAHALLEHAGDEVSVWGYEVHTPILRPTHVIDVTEVADVKRAALAAHETAAGAFELDTTLALNRWRSLGTRGGRGLAEAFHAADPTTLLELLGAGDALWSTDTNPSGA